MSTSAIPPIFTALVAFLGAEIWTIHKLCAAGGEDRSDTIQIALDEVVDVRLDTPLGP